MIKNLNQLRRTLREGTQLEILDHCRPECIGQIRNITLVNTQGFYSTVANQPDASANRGNGGRGPILWWGRAAHWQFADGVCSVFDSEQKHGPKRYAIPETWYKQSGTSGTPELQSILRGPLLLHSASALSGRTERSADSLRLLPSGTPHRMLAGSLDKVNRCSG